MDPNTVSNPTPPAIVSPPRGYVLRGKIMLSGIVVLFAIVMFILFLHLYVRWHVRRRYDRRRRRNRLFFEAASSEDQSQRPGQRGLEKEVLNSLTVEVFSGDDDVEEADCAVCINEFDEGEKVRLLPRCGHRFHVDCIDMWFCSHSTCPLCRCAVEAATSSLAPAEESDLLAGPAVSDLAVSDPDPRSREVRIEIPEESGSGSGSTSSGVVPVKLPGHRRLSSIRRFLIGIQIANPDPERGEPTDRAAPPPPPPPPPPASAQ